MTMSTGSRLTDRYTLQRRLAVGGVGEVWQAHDDVLGREVAVKLLKEEYADDPTAATRFRHEARHAASLTQPGIAGVYDYGEADGRAFLVMELVAGEPLSAVLAREGPLPVRRTLDVLAQAGLALQSAHDAGLVHRDVKPANLILRPDGVVKVTDFGIARAVGGVPLTDTGTVLGTAAYLSPEQSRGGPVTAASDIYALGVVGYECLAGRRPFHGDAPLQLAMAHVHHPPPPLPDTVPTGVRRLIGSALAKDPTERPASAGEFARTALLLRDSVDDTTPPTRVLPAVADRQGDPPTRVRPPARPEPSRRRVRAVMVAIAVVVVAAAALLLRACGPAPVTTVPQAIGQQVGDAASAMRHDGLAVTTSRVHDSHPAGVVLHQQPAAGTQVHQGSTVRLVISDGPAPVQVNGSDYVGEDYATAAADLSGLGLLVDRSTLESTAAPGSVLAVSPTGTLHVGDTVTVTVAVAPSPAPKDEGRPTKGKHHG